MSFFGTHDPLAVSIRIRLMRTLPRIEKLAQIKNSEMFRKRMMDVVDTGHTAWPAASPTLLKETKRIVRRKLKEAVDGGDVRELRIQAEELYRLCQPARSGHGARPLLLSRSSWCTRNRQDRFELRQNTAPGPRPAS